MERALAVRSFHREAPSMRLLRWIILPLLVVHVVLASISGYRAIVQVYRLTLHVPDAPLTPGSTIAFDVSTSGRTTTNVVLELRQGARAETLVVQVVPGSVNPSYDPRIRRGSATVTLTSPQLASFQAGPAIVRATANGRSQWLRVPPPVIQEQAVELRP